MRSSFQSLGAAAAMVLARQAAIAFVKDELRRRGERVASVAMREIYIAADDYLRQHPHLIEEATERTQRLGLAAQNSRQK